MRNIIRKQSDAYKAIIWLHNEGFRVFKWHKRGRNSDNLAFRGSIKYNTRAI